MDPASFGGSSRTDLSFSTTLTTKKENTVVEANQTCELELIADQLSREDIEETLEDKEAIKRFSIPQSTEQFDPPADALILSDGTLTIMRSDKDLYVTYYKRQEKESDEDGSPLRPQWCKWRRGGREELEVEDEEARWCDEASWEAFDKEQTGKGFSSSQPADCPGMSQPTRKTRSEAAQESGSRSGGNAKRALENLLHELRTQAGKSG